MRLFHQWTPSLLVAFEAKYKSSYLRVKLKRIKFELLTEPDLDHTRPGPDLTWTLNDLSLTASPLV